MKEKLTDIILSRKYEIYAAVVIEDNVDDVDRNTSKKKKLKIKKWNLYCSSTLLLVLRSHLYQSNWQVASVLVPIL